MVNHQPLKQQKQRLTQLFRARCLWMLVLFILLSLGLITRLIQLQCSQHHRYAKLSKNNILSMIPVAPDRGLIYDRNGVLLVKNVPNYILSLMPNNKSALETTVANIKKLIPISDKELASFFHSRYQYRHYQPIPLKYKLTEEQMARFYTNRYRLPGALITTQMIREYPTGDTMGPLLGYVGRVTQHDLSRIDFTDYRAQPLVGKSGIERQYEAELHGHSGNEQAETNANGHIVAALDRTAPVAGSNLILTIDIRLQRKAQQLLKDQEGAIVMIDPRNGEILAMYSAPSFDNNLFSGGISHTDYQKLLHDPSHPLFNRALRGRFAPGSTVKPFYALISLSTGLITNATSVHDTGTFVLPNTSHVFHDWKRNGHGWVNVNKAIRESCDVFFYQLAADMGVSRLNDILFQFGFGQKTNVDLPNEISGLVPTPSWKRRRIHKSWYTGDTIETGIGQGFFSTTPLELASAVAALAMQGQRYQPHLLKYVQAPTQPPTAAAITELAPVTNIKKGAWQQVTKAMREVIDSPLGTASLFGPHPGFSVAGKTGTAQVYGHTRDEETIRRNIPKKLRNNHLFIAFAPTRKPRVAIAVIVEHSAKADKMAGVMLRTYFAEYPHAKP